jgi:hypothetical protein
MGAAGFLPPSLLLVAVAAAYGGQLFRDAGWRGGEYAAAFVGVTACAVVGGAALRLLRPESPWRSFGSGMVVAGTLGVLVAVAIAALFVIAFAQTAGSRP